MGFKRICVLSAATGLALFGSAAVAQDFTVSDAVPAGIAIDDNGPGFEARTLTVAQGGPIRVVDLNVTLEFWPQDGSEGDCAAQGTGSGFSDEIAFRLTSPAGTEIALIVNDFGYDPFGDGETYPDSGNVPAAVTVTLDDAAADTVGSTNSGLPESGTFAPWRPLSAVNGEDANGDWILEFQDDTGLDELCYFSAELAFTTSSGTFFGSIDLDDGNPATNGSLSYASELDVPGTGITLADAGDNQNLTAELGVGFAAGQNRFFRIDLSDGAEFTQAPVLEVQGATDFDTGNLIAGGAGSSFAVYELTASIDYAQDDAVVVDVQDIDVFSEADVTATYRQYETATPAVNGSSTSLVEASQIAYRFVEALATNVLDAGEDTIEVATESTEFVQGNGDPVEDPFVDTDPDLGTTLSRVQIGVAAGVLFSDGLAAEMTDLVDAGTSLIVTGDFSAVSRDGMGNPVATDVVLNGSPADALSDTEASFVVDATVFGSGNPAVVTMVVDGNREIIDGPYSATYDVVAAAQADTGDVNLGEVSRLEKNGTTAEANFLLTPEGVFRNFVRITNPSGGDGAVFLQLINDEGDSVRFNLDDITVNNGGTPETLPAELSAGHSTPLININELFEAAQAVEPSFDVTGGPKANKLRLIVEAEFGAPAEVSGTGTVGGFFGPPMLLNGLIAPTGPDFEFNATTSRDTGVRIDVISVSNDNEAFFKFGN